MHDRWFLALSLLLVGCAGDSDDAGASAGGSAGVAGSASGGAAGSSAAGNAGAASGGTAGASAGGTAGATSGGAAGATSGGAAGATSGGAAGATSGGTGGGAGTSGCTPVTLGSLLTVDTEAGGSSLAFSVEGANATQDHVLYIEFFDVAGTPTSGSFDLSQAPDDNYSSCARCLLGFEDLGGASTPYYPASGSLVVTTADATFTGVSAGTFQDVVLVESTLVSSVTAPVAGGKCWSLGGGWAH